MKDNLVALMHEVLCTREHADGEDWTPCQWAADRMIAKLGGHDLVLVPMFKWVSIVKLLHGSYGSLVEEHLP